LFKKFEKLKRKIGAKRRIIIIVGFAYRSNMWQMPFFGAEIRRVVPAGYR
jgi:hypothetical protein